MKTEIKIRIEKDGKTIEAGSIENAKIIDEFVNGKLTIIFPNGREWEIGTGINKWPEVNQALNECGKIA